MSHLADKVAVITGGASGIGRALCRRLAAAGARVVVADLDEQGAGAVAREIGGRALRTDVGRAEGLAAQAAEVGAVDLFFSNAGVGVNGGVDAPDAAWDLSWRVNTMSHVWAARAVLPGMLARGSGAFVITASAAGLLTNIGAAPYAVAKHGAVALAEWLSVTYGGRGVHVACLCPMAVNTAMLQGDDLALRSVRAAGRTVEPDEVADVVLRALEEKRFLILPHPEVAQFLARKATTPDDWLAAMRRLAQRLEENH